MASLLKTYNNYQFNKYRTTLSIDYIIALCEEIPMYRELLTDENTINLKSIYNNFNEEENILLEEYYKKYKTTIKTYEKYLNHKFKQNNLEQFIPLINIGLTSDDIDMPACVLMIKNTINDIFILEIKDIITEFSKLADDNSEHPMLSYVNYQANSITTISKELNIYKHRLLKQLHKLENYDYYVKFGGASGMFNYLYVSYPKHNWSMFADNFISKYGLHRQYYTKIRHNTDDFIELFNIIKLINNILAEFISDIWFYISINYIELYNYLNHYKYSPKKTEALYFSECERNINLAYAILNSKDIFNSYSTSDVLFKNIETLLLFNMNSYTALSKGLKQIKFNYLAIDTDIQAYPNIVVDIINTILKTSGYYNQYKLFNNFYKKLNHQNITLHHVYSIIDKLEIPNDMKTNIKEMKMHNCINTKY